MKTDTELRHDIQQELAWDPSVDDADIGDAVSGGIVTLTGEVKSYAQKWNAARAIERVSGVRGLANEIHVRSSDEHTDTDIAMAAAAALRWNGSLPSEGVIVSVQNGWLTLSGTVTHDYQRRLAHDNVRHIRGVRGVTELITLESDAEAKDLKHKIDESIKRHAGIDAEHISVHLENGAVTLSGTVRSWAESHDAEETAWAGPGVISVNNKLNIQIAA
jgi:osmotically-inducible protein OsmY